MPSSSDQPRVPFDSFLLLFYDHVAQDAVRPLADYLAQFPGDEASITREYRAFMAAGAKGSFGRDPTQTSTEELGHYRKLRPIGQGGQADVYLAEDTKLHRHVALKVMRPGFTANRIAVERFKREAEITSRLDHPGICTVYETGVDRGDLWIAMRYVEGESLSDKISTAREGQAISGSVSIADVLENRDEWEGAPEKAETRPPSVPKGGAEITRILALFEEIARILHVANEAGVIHRDIKPGNLIVTKEGSPVILDFGLAEDVEGDMPSLTATGDAVGTPHYMSPEQIAGQRIRLDRRTDVYSLGVALFECLTLSRPFDASTREGIYLAILTTDAPDPRRLNRAVSKDLRVVLETAMQRDRERRYQTALDFAEDLRRVRSHEPILARRPGPMLRLRRWSQRNPQLAAALAGLFVALVAGLAVALFLLGSVKQELRRSEAIRLTSQSTANLATDPGLALLLALEATGREQSLATKNALLASLHELSEQRTYFGMSDVSASAGAESMALLSKTGRVTVVDLDHELSETEVTGLPGPAKLAVMSPAGDRIVIAMREGGAIVWSRSGTSPLVPREEIVEEALFSGDGDRIVLCESRPRLPKPRLQVWDTKPLKFVNERILENPAEICCNHAGRTIGVSPFYCRAYLFFTDTDKTVDVGSENSDGRVYAALNAIGDRVVTWHSLNGDSELSGTDTRVSIQAYKPQDRVRAAAFSPSGSLPRLAIGLDDGRVQLWNPADGSPMGDPLSGHTATVTAVAFSPEGREFATGSADHEVRLWRTSSGADLGVLRGHTNAVKRVIVGRDARTVVSRGDDDTVRVWSPSINQVGDTPNATEAHALLPSISPLGGRVADARDPGASVVKDAEASSELRDVAHAFFADTETLGWWNAFKQRDAVFSPDGRWVASVVERTGVALRNLESRELSRVLKPPSPCHGIRFLGFSPDSQLLAIRYYGRREAEPERCLISVRPQSEPVWLADPADSRHPVFVSRDGTLALTLGLSPPQCPTVLRTSDGAALPRLSDPTEDVITAAFSPDARRIIGGGKNGGVFVWDLERAAAPPVTFRHQRGGVVRSVCFSDDGRLALSAADDGARVWALDRGEEVLTIQTGRKVAAAIFSADQKRVIALGADGLTRGWPLSVVEEARRRKPRELTPDEVDRFETLPPEDRREHRATWDSRTGH